VGNLNDNKLNAKILILIVYALKLKCKEYRLYNLLICINCCFSFPRMILLISLLLVARNIAITIMRMLYILRSIGFAK